MRCISCRKKINVFRFFMNEGYCKECDGYTPPVANFTQAEMDEFLSEADVKKRGPLP